MNLGELISRLKQEPLDKIVKEGFTNPHSYRGNYYYIAFEPCENVSVADMLEDAKSALGTTYQGWKGGDFTMNKYSYVYLAEEGNIGDELSERLLNYMLKDEA